MARNNNQKAAEKSAATQLPAANEENVSDLPSVDLPVLDELDNVEGEHLESSDLPTQLPAANEENKIEKLPEKDDFEKHLEEEGFKHPQFFQNSLGKPVSKEQKEAVLNMIRKKIAKEEQVRVEAIQPNGTYPNRVRREVGEKFFIREAESFSFYWMKLVE